MVSIVVGVLFYSRGPGRVILRNYYTCGIAQHILLISDFNTITIQFGFYSLACVANFIFAYFRWRVILAYFFAIQDIGTWT